MLSLALQISKLVLSSCTPREILDFRQAQGFVYIKVGDEVLQQKVIQMTRMPVEKDDSDSDSASETETSLPRLGTMFNASVQQPWFTAVRNCDMEQVNKLKGKCAGTFDNCLAEVDGELPQHIGITGLMYGCIYGKVELIEALLESEILCVC